MTYKLKNLTFPWKASKRYQTLSVREEKRGYRVLGGDKGDLHFQGYSVDENGTELQGVEVVTYDDLTPEEVEAIANIIVDEAYASIREECVEHS